MSGKLILVGTPIGNLSDLTLRAKEALEICDFVAAEDTRVTSKLLNHLNISKPLVSYYEHNKFQKGDYIIDRILKGETCALCSDAGMPIISDPGDELVRLAYENNIEVTTAPGVTAMATALVLSGISSKRFTFEGFLSTNKRNRKEHLESLVKEERTMIFYEAPHKLKNTLNDMYKYFGNRNISLCRELTKIHEEIDRTTLERAIEKYETAIPKGEFVLVIEGCKEEVKDDISLDDAINLAEDLVSKGESIMMASKIVAKETGLKKSDIYNALQKNKS
jgi:16S rRNA (cytidine1402-2'-O)-methyltransferase